MPSAEVEHRRPYELAMDKLSARVALERANGSRSFEIASSVADKILSATSLDEIMAIPEQGPGNIEDFVGRAFHFKGMLDFQPAAEQYREGGVGYYVIFHVVDQQGNEHIISSGGTNLVFQFLAMEESGEMFQTDEWVSDTLHTIRSRPVPSGTLYWIAYA